MTQALTPIQHEPTFDRDFPRAPTEYTNSKVLVATTQYDMPIPTGAKFVLIECTGDVYFKFSKTAALPTLAVPSGATEDGTSGERLGNSEGKWFVISTSKWDHISFITGGTPVITASFYGL